MTLSELQRTLLDSYRELTGISTELVNKICQKNQLDVEIQTLQLRRESLANQINAIEKQSLALLQERLEEFEKTNSKSKQLKTKSEFNMKPVISSETASDGEHT